MAGRGNRTQAVSKATFRARNKKERDHEIRLKIIETIGTNEDLVPWLVLIGGTAAQGIEKLIAETQKSVRPGDTIEDIGITGWAKFLAPGAGGLDLLKFSQEEKAEYLGQIPSDDQWNDNPIGSLLRTGGMGMVGFSSAYLMLKAMSGGGSGGGLLSMAKLV